MRMQDCHDDLLAERFRQRYSTCTESRYPQEITQEMHQGSVSFPIRVGTPVTMQRHTNAFCIQSPQAPERLCSWGSPRGLPLSFGRFALIKSLMPELLSSPVGSHLPFVLGPFNRSADFCYSPLLGGKMARRNTLPRMCVVVSSLILGVLAASSACAGEIYGEAPTLILHGGIVVPMTEESARFEAIAIASDRIIALGTNEEMLALARADTEIVDLGGATVLPGFIDPHTHILTRSLFPDESWGEYGLVPITLDEAQEIFIENGITVAAESAFNPWVHEQYDYFAYAGQGRMRMKVHVFFIAVSCCCDDEQNGHVFELTDVPATFWYEQYAPKSEIAPGLFMGGLKIYAERSDSCPYMAYSFSDAVLAALPDAARERYADSDANLMLTETELTALIQRAQDGGYQVAIHAVGDRGIETSLNAIETVLSGEENTLHHMLYHSYFLRDDLVPRYSELGIVAVCESTDNCLVPQGNAWFGPEAMTLFRRWSDLAASGAIMANDSDWPPVHPLSPLLRLRELVTGENSPSLADPEPPQCPDYPTQTVTAWQALKMMTCNAAYALCIEDSYGTLETGKKADLVVLSGNPLDIETADLKHISVTATFIDGKLEYSDGRVVPEYSYLATQADDGGIDLTHVRWQTGVDDAARPDPISNYARVLAGSDLQGDYHALQWRSPNPVSLDLLGISGADWLGATGLEITLSADKEMEVLVWIIVSGDPAECTSFRRGITQVALPVSETPTVFQLTASDFGEDPYGPCTGPMPFGAFAGLDELFLIPSATGGELRVHRLAPCTDL